MSITKSITKFFKLFYRNRHHQRWGKSKGFTLLELLVALVLAAIVILPLLGFMIDAVNTDRKEVARSSTEQEIEQALEFMTDELQQAIYIYDSGGLYGDNNLNPPTPALINQLPPLVPVEGCRDTNCVPVLVFWKRENRKQILPYIAPGEPGYNLNNCNTCSTNPATCQCDDAFVYSLVAYYLATGNQNTTPGVNWSPTARIVRFAIRDGIVHPAKPTDTTGQPDYQYDPDPGFTRFDISNTTIRQAMNNWTRNGSYTNSATVLVDYLDQTTSGAPAVAACNPGDASPTSLDPLDRETLVPNIPSATAMTSFYACVNSNAARQSVRLFLRGNGLAKIGNWYSVPTYRNQDKIYFPTATAQVQGQSLLGGQS